MPKNKKSTQFLSLDRLREKAEPYRVVEIDGLGPVKLKVLGAEAAARLKELRDVISEESGELTKGKELQFGVMLLSLAIVDEHDNQTFDSDNGREALAELPFGAMQKLADAAIDHNRLLSEEQKKTD